MRRVAFFLCGCLCAVSAHAAVVEIYTAPKKAVPAAAKNDEAIRRAELAVVKRTVASLGKFEPVPARAIAVVHEEEPPARKATPNVAPPREPEPAARKAPAPVAQTRPTETPPRKVAAKVEPVRALPVAKAAPAPATREFTFKDRAGKVVAAPIVDRFQKNRIVYPLAKIDPRISPMLARAASIAQERAHAHSKSRCWRYVKNALLASGIISSYPKTAYAKEAGDELVRDYGFKKLPIRDPYKAPIGAVLVYGSRRAAGHVELRTKTGFVSDFQNKKPSPRPLLGIYAKA